ncbi:MAG: hypothetical protein SPK09_08065 [Porphyromonas sp.]|nr:hypothetical protein [Porphyromonas sp.]
MKKLIMMMALVGGLATVATAQDKPKTDKAKTEQKAADKQGKSCCKTTDKKDQKACDKKDAKACDKKASKSGDKASKASCCQKGKK